MKVKREKILELEEKIADLERKVQLLEIEITKTKQPLPQPWIVLSYPTYPFNPHLLIHNQLL